ncbi:MAG: TonB family protein [Gammaproteobacteria bacterium]
MNTMHPHLCPEFHFRIPPLAGSAQRLVFFLLISLVLHGLILSFIPAMEAIHPPVKTTRRGPVIIALETTPTHHDRRQKPHRAQPESSVTTTPADHPTGKLALATKQTPMATRSTHGTTLNSHSKTHLPVHAKPRTSLPHTTQTHHYHAKKAAVISPTAYPDEASRHTTATTRLITAAPSPDPAAVASLLRTALLRHFHYPVVALQNNWQGKVVLGMRVSATGQVQDAQILQTSGIRILDRAAQHSANAIGNLPAARPLLAGKTLRFRIPVSYRLQQ